MTEDESIINLPGEDDGWQAFVEFAEQFDKVELFKFLRLARGRGPENPLYKLQQKLALDLVAETGGVPLAGELLGYKPWGRRGEPQSMTDFNKFVKVARQAQDEGAL